MMANYPPQLSSRENFQPQAKSNKKLWIILGSVIGMLVIIMGGCVACGALIGLSQLNKEGRTTSGSRSNGSGEPGSTSDGSGEGGALAASSWTGTLNCDDGDNLPVNIKFAETGNPLYDYHTSSGLKAVELTSTGQRLRFVPPGGGVTNIVLDSLSVSSDRMSHTMSVSRERSAGGTMIQSRASITTEAVLSGSMLEVQTTIRSSSAASQPGYMIPDESATVCRGKLSRQ
jgi:hypothetical protein